MKEMGLVAEVVGVDSVLMARAAPADLAGQLRDGAPSLLRSG